MKNQIAPRFVYWVFLCALGFAAGPTAARAACIPTPDGLVAWWPFDGNLGDSLGTNIAVTLAPPHFGPGKSSQGLVLGNITSGPTAPPSPELNLGAANGVTIEGWINPSDNHPIQTIFEWGDRQGLIGLNLTLAQVEPFGDGAGSLWANLIDINNTAHWFPAVGNVIPSGVWSHFAFTFNKATGAAVLYANGVSVGQTNFPGITLETSFEFFLGKRVVGGTTQYPFIGAMDEISLYKRALTASEIQAIFQGGVDGKCRSAQAPYLFAQPQSLTVSVGQTATFSGLVGGASPHSYQWRLSGSDLAGATNATLVLNNVQLAQAGEYSLVVTNAVGSTTSSNATLTVLPPSSCVPPPEGLVVWWQFDGDSADYLGTNIAVTGASPQFGPGESGQGLVLGGTTSGPTAPPSPELNLGSSAGMTIEGWINPSDNHPIQTIFEWGNRQGLIGLNLTLAQVEPFADGAGSLWANLIDINNNPHWFPAVGNVIPSGVWSHFAFTFNKATGAAVLYANGVSVGQTNFPGITLETSFEFFLGKRVVGGTTQYPFIGAMDEISFYNRVLSSEEIQAVHGVGSAGKCRSPQAPRIFAQPQSLAILAGQTATFSVVAAGTAPLSYQWRLNGSDLAGATNATLVLNNAQLVQAGDYSAVVANALGSITSSNATLTVSLVPPTITAQPRSRTSFVGETVTFAVQANGTSPITYQWHFNNNDITDATNATLTLALVQMEQAGTYSVTLSNVVGVVSSSNAVLTLLPPSACLPLSPGMVSWWPFDGDGADFLGGNPAQTPGGSAFDEGQVDFALFLKANQPATTVAPSPTLDVGLGVGFTMEGWINPSDNSLIQTIFEWGDRQGQIGLHLALAQRIPFGGGAGSLWANLIDTNNNAHWFPTAGGLVPSGVWSHFAFTFDKASGVAVLYVNGAAANQTNFGNITVQTSYELFWGQRVVRQNVEYPFVGGFDEMGLYNRALSAAEVQAIHDVGSAGKCKTPRPPEIAGQPQNITVVAGDSAAFRVSANGTRPLTYQWSFNGSLIADATNATLTLSNVVSAQAGNYVVVVSNALGSTSSVAAVLSVVPGRTLALISPPAEQEGSVVSVPLNLISEGEVGGMTFNLNYDTTYIHVMECEWSPVMAGVFSDINTNTAGRVRITFALPATAIPSGEQPLATVRVRLRSVTHDLNTAMTVEVTDVSGPLGDPITLGTQTRDATVRITRRLLAGDNNANQRLDVGDATTILRYLSLLEVPRSWDIPANDINTNGIIDTGDAIRVLRAAAGIDPQPGGGGAARELIMFSNEKLVLTPATARGEVGSTIQFELRLQDVATTIAGAAFTLDYPTNALRLVNAQSFRVGATVPGNALAVWNLAPGQNNFVTQNGHVSLAVSAANQWSSSNGVLALLSFQVQPGASTRYAWPLVVRAGEVSPDGYANRVLQTYGATFFGRSAIAANLDGSERAAGGLFQFTLTGDAGSRYAVQASSNLMQWSSVTNVTLDAGGFRFIDADSAIFPRRFYRALLLEP